MAVWSDWYPDLMPHLPGCPAPIVEHELRRACQVFFEGSRAWKKKLPAIAITAGDESKMLTTGDVGIDVVRVEQAWYDGKPLDVFTLEELAGAFSDDWRSHTGTPIAIIQMEPGIVRLYPLPNANATIGLVVEASIKPSDSAAGIPDNHRVKFKEAIASGAKGRLMLYPNKPWSNVDSALAMVSAFDAAVSKSRLEAALSFGGGSIRSRPKWC